MRLELIAWTPHAEEICAAAAYLCYHPANLSNFGSIPPEKVPPLLSKVITSGHHSVLEHVSFTFAVEGISRVCTHQLVRHRIASYSQQSQRHVQVKETEFVIPPKILSDPHTKEIFEESLNLSFQAYQKLINSGISIEDARYLLPQASKSRLVFTMNARELWHFFELRCCEKAQWEIRTLAFWALRKVKEIAPNLFREAGPKCFHGICTESDFPCWRFGSAFFKKKKAQFAELLSQITSNYEEIKLPEFTLNPLKITEELGCSLSQLLQAAIGELAGEPIVILAPDPSRLVEKLKAEFGEALVLWDKEKVLNRTGFSTLAVPIIPFKDHVVYFVQQDILKEDCLFTNLASPWWYAKIPGRALKKLSNFAKEVKVL
jgi:thymidylate synthase (FAD)